MATSKDKPGRFAVRALKWLGAGVLTLALLAGAGWGYLEWRFGIPEEPDAVAALLRLQDEAVPPGDDAWPLYRQIILEEYAIPDLEPRWQQRAGDLYQRTEGLMNTHRINFAGGEWSDPSFEPLREVLADSQRLLALFDEAAARPACRFPIHTEGDELHGTRIPGVMKPYSSFAMFGPAAALLRIQTIAMASMRDHASRGEWDTVRRRIGSLIAFAHHLRMNRGILGTLSLNQESEVHLWVWRLAHEFQADAAEVDRLIAFLEDLDPPGAITHLLKEQSLLVPGIVYIYTPEFILTDRETWADAWEAPRARKVTKQLHRALRQTYAEFEKPRHERTPVAHEIPEGLDLPLTACQILIDDWDFLAMNRRAALVGLHIERFHREHGRWPDTLDEALPDTALAQIGPGMTLEYDPTPSAWWPYQLSGPEGMPYRRIQLRLLTRDPGPAIMPKFKWDDDEPQPGAPASD